MPHRRHGARSRRCSTRVADDRYGRLDVLVNNAATNPYYGHVLDTDLGAFQKTVDVNIRGYFFASVLGGPDDARRAAAARSSTSRR